MSKPDLVRLDFVAPPGTARGAGLLLCAVGLAAAIGVGLLFDAQVAERNRLDAELNSASQAHRPALPAAIHSGEEAAKIEAELTIPWSRLLAELEAAGKDTDATISLLKVEPDPGKHTVMITAEARSLPAALAYLQRLQKSQMLRYPMLESHEIKKDDPEHPVRIKLAAEWRA